ncbi:IS66 family insertion sequence element accessory protein TnpB [Ornithinibacillus sp. L9]|uniref:IS66 family insertion sequence element accessory protein TnpB n=1 Tax=Ornithinibacillus caprae TaxID=2678566 RepID=A0A6N8FHP2_9BACI|nr:IS66 family insertion sequence element accessory protein TnpB [Ornithinibacillus caprae]MUK86828.1 IS66 family insertion sequence element accessory protein TnpB [Ornithinibacillus caprae]
MTKAQKRIEWKARFDAWKASGLSVAEWCRVEGVKDHQMYYWIRRFEDEIDSESEVQWLAVDMQSETTGHISDQSVFIHVGQLSIEVRPGTNMALLSDVVHVLHKQ